MSLTTRESYSLIKEVMSWEDFPLEKRLNCLKSTKQTLRQKLKPLEKDPFDPVFHVSDEYPYGGHYYSKEFFDTTFTDEEKSIFIEENWEHIPYYPWDCSHQRFSMRIEICNFKEPNSFGAMSCVYHFYGIDC